MLIIITSTADELSGATNIGDLELVLLRLSKPVPKPRFYASLLTVRFWNGAALVSWTLTACKSSRSLISPAGVIVGIKGEIAGGGGPAPRVGD